MGADHVGLDLLEGKMKATVVQSITKIAAIAVLLGGGYVHANPAAQMQCLIRHRDQPESRQQPPRVTPLKQPMSAEALQCSSKCRAAVLAC